MADKGIPFNNRHYVCELGDVELLAQVILCCPLYSSLKFLDLLLHSSKKKGYLENEILIYILTASAQNLVEKAATFLELVIRSSRFNHCSQGGSYLFATVTVYFIYAYKGSVDDDEETVANILADLNFFTVCF